MNSASGAPLSEILQLNVTFDPVVDMCIETVANITGGAVNEIKLMKVQVKRCC